MKYSFGDFFAHVEINGDKKIFRQGNVCGMHPYGFEHRCIEKAEIVTVAALVGDGLVGVLNIIHCLRIGMGADIEGGRVGRIGDAREAKPFEEPHTILKIFTDIGPHTVAYQAGDEFRKIEDDRVVRGDKHGRNPVVFPDCRVPVIDRYRRSCLRENSAEGLRIYRQKVRSKLVRDYTETVCMRRLLKG